MKKKQPTLQPGGARPFRELGLAASCVVVQDVEEKWTCFFVACDLPKITLGELIMG